MTQNQKLYDQNERFLFLVWKCIELGSTLGRRVHRNVDQQQF